MTPSGSENSAAVASPRAGAREKRGQGSVGSRKSAELTGREERWHAQHAGQNSPGGTVACPARRDGSANGGKGQRYR
jgi:hypothetical protein